MELFEAIEKRKSIRAFEKKEVPMAEIEKIVDAGRVAPSAMNSQPWEFVVVRNAEKKKAIRQAYEEARDAKGFYQQDTQFVENATLIVVCCSEEKQSRIISCALAIENMLLAATALDLGSIVMTAPIGHEESKKKIMEICKLPQAIDPIALLALGYTAEKPEPKEKRSLKEVLHLDEY